MDGSPAAARSTPRPPVTRGAPLRPSAGPTSYVSDCVCVPPSPTPLCTCVTSPPKSTSSHAHVCVCACPMSMKKNAGEKRRGTKSSRRRCRNKAKNRSKSKLNNKEHLVPPRRVLRNGKWEQSFSIYRIRAGLKCFFNDGKFVVRVFVYMLQTLTFITAYV